MVLVDLKGEGLFAGSGGFGVEGEVRIEAGGGDVIAVIDERDRFADAGGTEEAEQAGSAPELAAGRDGLEDDGDAREGRTALGKEDEVGGREYGGEQHFVGNGAAVDGD